MTLKLEDIPAPVSTRATPKIQSAKTCPDCQLNIENTARFCSNCGSSLPVEPGNPITSPQYERAENTAPPKLIYAGFVYAGLIKRAMAYVIDLIIAAVFITAIAYLFSTPLTDALSADLQSYALTLIQQPMLYIAWWLYFSVAESSVHQATLGKRILKILVCNREGQKLSFFHALFRQICGALSFLTAGVGYLLILVTRHKQSLHDFLADTLVINESTPPSQVALINQGSQRLANWQSILLSANLLLAACLYVFWQPVSDYFDRYDSQIAPQTILKQNQYFQDSLLRFYQKAGKWPETAAQLASFVPLATSHHSKFIITGDGNYHQLFLKPSPWQGKIIIWQKHIAPKPKSQWRCTSHSLPYDSLPADCRD